jgi:hypothetical protein
MNLILYLPAEIICLNNIKICKWQKLTVLQLIELCIFSIKIESKGVTEI